MAKRRGSKQRAPGEHVALERPAVDARIHTAVRVVAMEEGEAATLTYSRILAAGLHALGHADLYAQALEFGTVHDKDDKQRLLSTLLATAGLPEEAPMAS
ncbi:hypothetical protein [Amycolatopsis magusensis]|uniref:hypothetical protein n=1 Tax=Amycolatopsis magusensis TaxID=882444 RepID=UPI0037A2143D